MICPRCSVGEISETTQECLVCGFSQTGGVAVETSDWSQLDDPVLPALERQFQVEGVLRRGAASRIYLARDQVTGRLCSLKLLPLAADTSPAVIDRFRQDAQRASALDHPHLVQVHRFGVTDTALWYAMEYCQGRSLADLLRTADRMELKTCLRLVEQIASALEYGHRRGVTHGNLKPSNVLVDPEGWARVADFGLTGAFGPLPPRQPELSFEENYGHVAPERFGASGETGPLADQYALAVLAFTCFARRPPFVGDTLEEITQHHLDGQAPSLDEARPDLPSYVSTALARAMSRRPNDRFGGVLDFVTALGGVAVPTPEPEVEAAPAVAVAPAAQAAPLPEPPPLERVPVAQPVPVEQTAPVAESVWAAQEAPAVQAASLETPTAQQSAGPPLLFVERGPDSRLPMDDDDDEDEVEADVGTADVAHAVAPRNEAEDEEDTEPDAPGPVLLWPAPQSPEPVGVALATDVPPGPEAEQDRQPVLLVQEFGRQRRRWVRVARRLKSYWSSLPRHTRIGSSAAAAVMLLALVWWRVASGGKHEQRPLPDWVGEAPPTGVAGSAVTPNVTRPTPPRPRETRRSTATGISGTRRTTDSAGPRTAPPSQLAEPAHLFINATPWGQLFIDDRAMGNTPKADLQVRPGTHRIRITRDGYLPYETVIAIESGEVLRLTDIVLQERQQ